MIRDLTIKFSGAQMIILGLDISTSNVGWCLLESGDCQRHRFVRAGSIRVSEKEGLYDKARYVRESLIEACQGVTPDAVSIEESLMSFGKRRSSAGTIAILNRFNGIVSFIARDTFGSPVAFVNSVAARKKVGLKIDKDSGVDTKEQIFEWARSHELLNGYEWPTKVISRGERKGQTVYEPWCYDISDAFVTALWACGNLNKSMLSSTIC
jgi:Holliday junction resolvasome RuvABC endonuclease subunit